MGHDRCCGGDLHFGRFLSAAGQARGQAKQEDLESRCPDHVHFPAFTFSTTSFASSMTLGLSDSCVSLLSARIFLQSSRSSGFNRLWSPRQTCPMGPSAAPLCANKATVTTFCPTYVTR